MLPTVWQDDGAHSCVALRPRACGRIAHRRRRRRRCHEHLRVGPCAEHNCGTPADIVGGCAAGGLRSHLRRPTATGAWSSCSSPPAPTSPPRQTSGKGHVPDAAPVGCGSVICGRRTALMNAAEGGHLRAVEVLIAAGADVAAENDLGYGPHSVPQRNRGTLSDVVANCAAGALRSWRRHTKVTRAWSRCSSRLAPTCAATPGATVRRVHPSSPRLYRMVRQRDGTPAGGPRWSCGHHRDARRRRR